MAGTEENPVRLDPWQNIIEVGWNTITHVAFHVIGTANPTHEDDTPPPDPGLGNRLELSFAEYNSYHPVVVVSDVAWVYALGDPRDESIFRSGSWEGADLAEWEMPGGLPPVVGAATGTDYASSLDFAWNAGSGGGGGDMHVPGQPDTPFSSGLSPVLEGHGLLAVAGTAEWVEAPNFAFKYAAPTGPGPVPVGTLAVDAGGVIVLYRNKAFRSIATAAYTVTSTAHHLWILCERSPDDDPEPEE